MSHFYVTTEGRMQQVEGNMDRSSKADKAVRTEEGSWRQEYT